MSAGGRGRARSRRQVLRCFVLTLCAAGALVLFGLLTSASANAAVGSARHATTSWGAGHTITPATTTWGAILPWRSLASGRPLRGLAVGYLDRYVWLGRQFGLRREHTGQIRRHGLTWLRPARQRLL